MASTVATASNLRIFGAATGILLSRSWNDSLSRQLKSTPIHCEGDGLYRHSKDDPKKVLEWHKKGGGYLHPSLYATQLPGKGWALCTRKEEATIPAGTVLVRTPQELLWIAHESESSEVVEPLAPGRFFFEGWCRCFLELSIFQQLISTHFNLEIVSHILRWEVRCGTLFRSLSPLTCSII